MAKALDSCGNQILRVKCRESNPANQMPGIKCRNQILAAQAGGVPGRARSCLVVLGRAWSRLVVPGRRDSGGVDYGFLGAAALGTSWHGSCGMLRLSVSRFVRLAV